jgi:hypothetical protein
MSQRVVKQPNTRMARRLMWFAGFISIWALFMLCWLASSPGALVTVVISVLLVDGAIFAYATSKGYWFERRVERIWNKTCGGIGFVSEKSQTIMNPLWVAGAQSFTRQHETKQYPKLREVHGDRHSWTGLITAFAGQDPSDYNAYADKFAFSFMVPTVSFEAAEDGRIRIYAGKVPVPAEYEYKPVKHTASSRVVAKAETAPRKEKKHTVPVDYSGYGSVFPDTWSQPTMEIMPERAQAEAAQVKRAEYQQPDARDAQQPAGARYADQQVVEIEARPKEELSSVCRRMEGIAAEHFVLFVPRRAQMSSDPWWRIMYWRMRQLGKDVTVVSPDKQVREAAGAAGFLVLDSKIAHTKPRSSSPVVPPVLAAGPQAQAVPSYDSERALLRSVPMAVDKQGRVWHMPIEETHVLVAARTGGGKGSWIWSLVLRLEPAFRAGLVKFWGCDPKRLELAIGRDWWEHYADTDVGMVELLEQAVREMFDRGSQLQGVARKFTPSVETPLNVVVIDELGYLSSLLTDRKLQMRADIAIKTLLMQGRSNGFAVVGAVQDPRKATVEYRDLFPIRIAGGLNEGKMVDLVLGEDMHDKGAFCESLPLGRQGAGVAYVLDIENDNKPRMVRAAWCSDATIKNVLDPRTRARAEAYEVKDEQPYGQLRPQPGWQYKVE